MSFTSLPSELVLELSRYLDLHGINALMQSSKSLYGTLHEYLYRYDAQISAENRAILWAAKHDYRNVAKFSLDCGGSILAQEGPELDTPFELAAHFGSESVLSLLLEHGDRSQAFSDHGRVCRYTTALRKAAWYGQLGTARQLLDHGVNPFVSLLQNTEKGYYVRGIAVYYAAQAGQVEIMNLFLDSQYKLEQGAAWKPFTTALEFGKEEFALLLLDRGVIDLDFTKVKADHCILRAAEGGCDRVLRRFIDAGMDLAELDCRINTSAVALAAREGRTSTVKLLIDHGCDPHRGHGGYSPLELATLRGHERIIPILLEVCIDVNDEDLPSSFALVHAARRGDERKVQQLIDAGADLDLTRNTESLKWDITALAAAADEGYENIVRMLIAAGANVNAPQPGPSALSLATKKDPDSSLVRLLLDHGAIMGDTADLEGSENF